LFCGFSVFPDSLAASFSLVVLTAFATLNLTLDLRGAENRHALRILAAATVAVYFLEIFASPPNPYRQPLTPLAALATGLASAALLYLPVRRGAHWVGKAFVTAATISTLTVLAARSALLLSQTPLLYALLPTDLRPLSLPLLATLTPPLTRRFREFEVGYVKVVEIPENYLQRQKNHDNPPDALPDSPEARGFIQAMVARGARFTLVTGFVEGEGIVLFMVQGGEQAAKYLGAMYESRIPGLKTQPAGRVEIVVPNPVVLHLDGRAKPTTEAPLEAVYEQFAQRELNGIVFVHARPHNTLHERLQLFRKRRLLDEMARRRAQNQQASTRERRLQLEVEHGLLGVGVYVVVSGETEEQSRRNAETLVGALALGVENPRHIKTASGRKAERILERILRVRCGAPMTVSRWEASTLLQLPRRDIGVRVRKTAAFAHTPTPAESPSLPVGSLMRNGRRLERGVGLETRYLNSHILVVGATKAGKSNLMLHLCLTLHERGINFVVIEPIKQEYRTLLNHIDINVFTAGDETLCPLRFNPLAVTKGIQVGTHISNLVEIFRYVFHLWPPLPELLRMALVQTYRRKGWNIRTNTRGQTPTLIDLCDEMEEISRESGYEDRVKHNILAAFITRMRSLTIDNLGEMLVPVNSVPFEVLTQRPTVIELQSLGGDDKVLVASLLLNWIYENHQVRGRAGRHVVDTLCIIEEAHRIVGDRRGGFGEEDSRIGEFSSRILSQLLSEARGFGLGVALVDQYPGRLPEDAIKNTHTKFLLQLPDEEDRKRVGLSIGLEPEQIRSILDFETGVALLWNQGEPVRQIKTPNLRELGYNLQPVSDQRVREHMAPLYHLYGWHEHNPLVDVMPSEIYAQHRIRKKRSEEPASTDAGRTDLHVTIEKVVSTGKFARIYRELNRPPHHRLNRFLEKTAENIAGFHGTPERRGEILEALRRLAAARYSQGSG